MNYSIFAAVFLMLESPDDNKNKRMELRNWFIRIMGTSKEEGPVRGIFCEKCFEKDEIGDGSKCDDNHMDNDFQCPCRNVKIINVAYTPGPYDFIITLLCTDLGSLEYFIDKCMHYSKACESTVKDTLTYVGVPLENCRMTLKAGEDKAEEATMSVID